MHCPGGNATDSIWRVLASSDGISCWAPLKPLHNNPKPNSLANKLWCIDFLTPPTPLIIPHRPPFFFECLMPLKHWCSIHERWSKSSLKHSIRFCGIFSQCICVNLSFQWVHMSWKEYFMLAEEIGVVRDENYILCTSIYLCEKHKSTTK